MSTAVPTMAERPTVTFWQIWNMCFGFLGVQFAFALQNVTSAASSRHWVRRWTRSRACGSRRR